MNDLQKVLLDIAIEFTSCCDKLNLTYYAVGGTALGAIRHNGFIPWDDDMDFAMPRKDYEVFLKKAKAFLPDYLFIQTSKTDRYYCYPFCKIRNSNTTMIENTLSSLQINHGCWIDVFPLDSLPSNQKYLNKYRKRMSLYYQFLMLYINFYVDVGKRIRVLSYFFNRFTTIRRLFLFLRNRYSSSFDSSSNGHVWWNWPAYDSFILEKKWLGKGIFVEFESIKIRIPELYNDYLSSQYGDWTELPSEECRISTHNSYVDLYNSYIIYYGVKYCAKKSF